MKAKKESDKDAGDFKTLIEESFNERWSLVLEMALTKIGFRNDGSTSVNEYSWD